MTGDTRYGLPYVPLSQQSATCRTSVVLAIPHGQSYTIRSLVTLRWTLDKGLESAV
jgi:hypothetical protein